MRGRGRILNEGQGRVLDERGDLLSGELDLLTRGRFLRDHFLRGRILNDGRDLLTRLID